MLCFKRFLGPSWSWYNYLCNQYISPLKLWVRIQLMRGALDTTLCNKACQWLAAGRWFSPKPPASSANKAPPRYSWNIVESDLKHHNPNPLSHSLIVFPNPLLYYVMLPLYLYCYYILYRSCIWKWKISSHIVSYRVCSGVCPMVLCYQWITIDRPMVPSIVLLRVVMFSLTSDAP